MSFFRFRKILRTLTPEQRRKWAQMRKEFSTPRVDIGVAYLPPTVARSFTHIRSW